VGILGGKPNFALYFVGYQGNHMIFLDPHFVQDALSGEGDLQVDELRNTYQS
jgi:cysteine protease ATG4